MLSSIFKKKGSQVPTIQERDQRDLRPVQYQIEDEESKKSKIIYYMPKVNSKIFEPQEWSIQSFQIGRHIGKGKYGHVYLARERKTKHIVALKVLSKKQLINSQIICQLRRQIQIHSHLQHQNILKMYGFFFDQKRIYMIMQYAPLGQLYKKLQNQITFQESVSSRYTYQILSAMKHLHSLHIIHRDLKPQNILVFDQNTVKLSDFGWAVHTSKTRKTFCGTVDYIGPQIAFRQPYNTCLDMWTIGVLAYELSSGFAPFAADSRSETQRRVKNLQYRFPIQFSAELRDFISRLLVIKPQDRMTQEQALNHPWILQYNKR